jgi:hypothetical protein
MSEVARRTIDAGLYLLDRQIVDKNGLLAGKVDDLELTFPDGTEEPPFISAILSGPGVLARRVRRREGGWLEALSTKLTEQTDPPRISFGVVKKIDNHVELTVSREHLDASRLEAWVRDHIISKIPGAHVEAE